MKFNLIMPISDEHWILSCTTGWSLGIEPTATTPTPARARAHTHTHTHIHTARERARGGDTT